MVKSRGHIGCTLCMKSPSPQVDSTHLVYRSTKRPRLCLKAEISAVGKCPHCAGCTHSIFKRSLCPTLSLQQRGPCQWAQSNQTPRRALCGVMLGFSYSFSLLYVPRNPVLWEIERSPPSSSPQPLFHRLSCTTCELDKVRIHVTEKSCLCLATPLYAMTPVE